MPRPYTKPSATAAERITHLRSKGLDVPRPSIAARKIEAVGYERLRIYFLSRRDAPGKRFRPGTTYHDVLDLYECDAKLRALCFEAVGRFELGFRNTLSDVLTARFGSHPYHQRRAFRSGTAQNDALAQVVSVFQRSKDERARHYRQTYDDPALPPIWTFKEFLTFGAGARLYATLANDVRQDVAKAFQVAKLPVFDSWVPGLVDLRNICAHHDRLFNRRFQKQPQRLLRANVPTAPSNTLKAQLECLDHLLTAVGETSGTTARADRIIRGSRAMQPAEAGF